MSRLSVISFVILVAAGGAAEQTVGWRNDGSGHFPNATPPLKWSRSADGKTENIVWQSRMPMDSPSSPIVAGKYVFTTANNFSLVCIAKETGRILWVRPVSPYDAATKEERETNKEEFAELDKLAAKRDELCAKNSGGVRGGCRENRRGDRESRARDGEARRRYGQGQI